MNRAGLAAASLGLALCGCETPPPKPAPLQPMPIFTGDVAAPPAPVADDREVRATMVTGNPPAPVPPRPGVIASAGGEVTLNFPAAPPEAVAQAVLGDLLRVPYQVSPLATAPVTLVTRGAVPRSSLMTLFENALKASNLALTLAGGVLTVQPLDMARTAGVVAAADTPGFGSETIVLSFINAGQMRAVIEPILPGVVSAEDPTRNALVLSGTAGQRGSARDLIAQFDVNWLRGMSFALLVPQRTDARLIVPELEKLLNGETAPTRGLVRLIAMERLNGLLAITAQRQYLDDVRRWVEILDREGQNSEPRLFVYRVQNGRSKDLARVLNTSFGGSADDTEAATVADSFALDGSQRTGGAPPSARPADPPAAPPAPANATPIPPGATPVRATISSDEANNAIIVFGTPRDYAVIEDALRKLDLLPQQVLIEAAITEVTLNDDMRYGVQWNFQQGETNFALTDNSTSVPTRVFPGFSFFFSNDSISTTLNALERRTKVNVISAPKLLVLNNQTAALQVGNQVPIATQAAVGVINPDAPIVNSIEYRDTGVILKVTPRVNAGGLVLLDISQEVSDVTPTDTSTINSPTISTRRISTSIAVQDGQVIALGGLIRDTRSAGTSGLPFLSRIPILGGLLFGKTTNVGVRTELLVLLKPRVLRSIDDARAATDELRAKIRSIAPSKSGGTVP